MQYNHYPLLTFLLYLRTLCRMERGALIGFLHRLLIAFKSFEVFININHTHMKTLHILTCFKTHCESALLSVIHYAFMFSWLKNNYFIEMSDIK